MVGSYNPRLAPPLPLTVHSQCKLWHSVPSMMHVVLGAQLTMDHRDVLLCALWKCTKHHLPNRNATINGWCWVLFPLQYWLWAIWLHEHVSKTRYVVPIFIAALVVKPWCCLFSTHGDFWWEIWHLLDFIWEQYGLLPLMLIAKLQLIDEIYTVYCSKLGTIK